jgi:pyruvate dehydrogenase E2 component (dihydrolipoamide acetyltransferase)
MKNILMPKLSDTMTEGLLGGWVKSVGDAISRGEIIAEVETDKATMGLEAFEDGVLLEQRVRAGETVPVGTVLGVMGRPDEKPLEPVAAPETAEVEPMAPAPAAVTEPSRGEQASSPATPVHREKASPVVRRRARELGLDLESIQGSGPDGRVLLEDLEQVAPAGEGAPSNVPEHRQPAAKQTTADGESRQTRMRRAIAGTVSSSWREIPHFFVTMDIVMDTAEEVRRELQISGSLVSVNDLVLKGVTVALSSHPHLNGIYTDSGLVPQQEINLGLAVNVPDGLLMPVLKGAGSLSLGEMAVRSRDLVELARSGRLAPADLDGGTFSVSNLGPQGVSQFSALIFPPQVAVLAVGAVCETIIPRNGEAVVGKVMKVTLSADHRAVDGAYAAGFLQELKSVLENPVRLLL